MDISEGADDLPQTVAARVVDDLAALRSLVAQLLHGYSSLHQTRDDPSSNVFFINPDGDCWFNPLRDGGPRLQQEILRRLGDVFEVVNLLLLHAPDQVYRRALEQRELVKKLVEQERATWSTDLRTLAEQGTEALGVVGQLIAERYETAPGRVVLVPDTNVVLNNPGFHAWRLPTSGRSRL